MSQDTSSTPSPEENSFSIQPIGFIASDLKEKFGTPRQAGLCLSVASSIILENSAFNREAITGLENCSHLWVLAWFHKNKDMKARSLVRPPRLGGNTKVGVYSTRSPYRPNPISISACALNGIVFKKNEIIIEIDGCDLVHGTPVIDIKPYIPYADAIEDSSAGWADGDWPILEVSYSPQARAILDKNQLEDGLTEILCQDPRPAYQKKNEGKVYTFQYNAFDISFKTINETHVRVEEITALKDKNGK
jgi:tRNA-Thr(GGU) m(6)t(6)A37 methyltransferase TsaA